MPTIAKAADAAQFLSLVPRLLGFVPTRSLVLVPMCRGRSLGALRVDLPVDGDSAVGDTVAATTIGMMCRIAEADAAMVVVYTDAGITTALPHREFIGTLLARADACGLAVPDALVVAADGWASYLDGDVSTGAHSLAELGDP
ncbi:DUF4192 family protein, partial [Microbacterium sp.]|uniref:DUF4192 family protein n=1 Tax=Microbacterium sp. TaxID=51671 RepID=UPI003C72D533